MNSLNNTSVRPELEVVCVYLCVCVVRVCVCVCMYDENLHHLYIVFFGEFAQIWGTFTFSLAHKQD